MDNPNMPKPQDALASATEQAQAAAKTLKEQAECWMNKATGYAHKHPITSVAVAVGVGALAGYLLSSLRNRG